jgi:hypothetical protein
VDEDSVGSEMTRVGSDLTDLRRRVTALEAEHARLLSCRTVDEESARLQAARSSAGLELAGDLPHEQFSPAYLGRAVVAVENHLADMERFAATGDERAAQESKLAAAMRSCSTLRMLCDDDDFIQTLMDMAQHANDPNNNVQDYISGNTSPTFSFRDNEIEMLQIAGLPELLAREHVDAAISAYNGGPGAALARLQNPMLMLNDLRRLRDASCQTADVLSSGIRQQRSRQRWKKMLTFGLGGTLIVTVNSIGTALLGPPGAAASGAIGSAAVGVAVQFLS